MSKSIYFNIGNFLGKVPAFLFLAIYLISIVVFAAIYTFIPNHFYQTNAYVEVDYINKKEIVMASYEAILYDKIKELLPCELVYPKFKYLYIENITFTESNVFFHSQIIYEEALGEKLEENPAQLSSTIPIIFMSPINIIDSKIYGDSGQVNTDYRIFRAYKYDDTLFDKSFVSALDKPLKGLADSKVERYLSDLQLAVSGNTRNLDFSFLRMFYFSVVTITTLGYGDIVPTTELSRFLISVEAIIGIVLLGLFVNSIMHERTNK